MLKCQEYPIIVFMSLIDYVEKIKAEFPQIERYFIGFLLVKSSINHCMKELRRLKV